MKVALVLGLAFFCSLWSGGKLMFLVRNTLLIRVVVIRFARGLLLARE